VVGINQAVWEPLTNTLYVESDQQLAQSTTYLLVVTRDVRDTKGKRIDGKLGDDENEGDANEAYRKALRNALRAAGIDREDVATASLFTTQSITATSTKIRSQLQATPLSFGAPDARNVFLASSLRNIEWDSQTTVSGPLTLAGFIPTQALAGAGVGTIAFGSYASPDYENADEVIPAVG